ncbi:MAG: hypothetical protein A2Y77_07775 [Planctomycetes bacterium RBG_13_62_9]|nr:MAG: hypothetical protein A2Y77_07775 [Planctomycetes bacterium RBG_13_62_9]
MLRKAPGFTAIALITLAIGIGANAITFSVADVLLLRPLGVKEPEQLVCCGISDMLTDYFGYLTISDSNQAFSDFMAQDEGRSVTLAGQDMTGRVNAMFVSGNYFSFLGVVPARGRGFLPEEDRQDATPAVVLSHRLWQRQGADPAIVGQSLRINGVPCQVVGVAPEGFTGTTLAGPDLWLPMGGYLSTMVLARGESKPPEKWRFAEYPLPVIPVGRLKPGVSLADAQASLQPVAARLKAQFPRHWTPRSSLYLYLPPRVSPMATGASRSGATYRANERSMITRYSLFLLGISGTILVIACFNLGNMLIIRGTGRGREMALRLALGGGRLQIIRQLLIEALLLALLGGVLGLILASWGTSILNTWFAASQQARWRCLQTSLSIRVLGMTLGMSLIATLLFGLRPALGLSRRDIMGELKESGSAMLGPAKRRRGDLSVLCQIALTVVLVMIAVMFTRRALVLARSEDSFHLDNTLVVALDPLSAGYDQIRSTQVCETLADRLESLPGVGSLGMSPSFSFGDGGVDSIYTYIPGAKGDDSERLLANSAAAPHIGRDYFPSVGLPLLQGRSFSRLDSVADAGNVAIIDERLAGKLDPNGHALGAWIRYGAFADRSEPYRVVGIVPSIPGAQGKPTFAQTYTPAKPDEMCPVFYLRLKDPRSAVVMEQRILAAIRAVDPQVPVLSMTTLADRRRDHNILWFAGMCVRLTGTAGAIALFLAALGIWAVKGFMVASRTREIGIRKALGATQREVMGMVFKEGLILTAVGLIAGLLLGWGATRMIASAVHGYEVIDPAGIGITLALLGLISLLAGYMPARRAARIDPMVTLRCE